MKAKASFLMFSFAYMGRTGVQLPINVTVTRYGCAVSNEIVQGTLTPLPH